MTEDPAPYGSLLYQADPEARWNRLLEAAECHNQSELAAFLGLRQFVVSDAKRRGSIPSEWLLTLLRERWINPAWILTGAGARFLQTVPVAGGSLSWSGAGGMRA